MNAHQLNVSLCSPVVSQYVNKDVRSRRDSDSERFAFNNSPKNSCCLRRRPNDTNRKLQQELHGIFTNTQAQKWQASFFYFCSSSRLSFLRFCKKKKKVVQGSSSFKERENKPDSRRTGRRFRGWYSPKSQMMNV